MDRTAWSRVLGAVALLGTASPAGGEVPDGCTPAWPGDPPARLLFDLREVGRAPALPACAGRLFTAVFQASRDVARRGPFPAGLYATGGNLADPNVLLRGPAIFRGMGGMIASTEVEANLQTWNWHPDSAVSREILDGIARLHARRKAAAHPRSADGRTPAGPSVPAAPVVVRLLVNFAPTASEAMMSTLAARIEGLKLDPGVVRVELAGFHHSALGANHSKDLVVDGRHAIVTGANVTGDNDTDDDYLDAGFRFDGEVAGALRQEFADAWGRSWRWTCGASHPRAGSEPGPEDRPAPVCWERLSVPPPIPLTRLPGCSPMLVTTRPANGIPWLRGADDENPQNRAFLAAIRNATSIVKLQTPNLNEPTVERALIETLKRGVRVELLLSRRYEEWTESMPTRGGTNDESVERLFRAARRAGIDACRQLAIRWYSADGSDVVTENGPPASHVKYLSVDGELAIVGSANMDVQSFRNSREINVVVDSAATTAAWDEQLFDPSFARSLSIRSCR